MTIFRNGKGRRKFERAGFDSGSPGVDTQPRALAYFTVSGLLFGLSLVGLAPTFELAMVAMFGIGAGSGGFQALGASVAAHE